MSNEKALNIDEVLNMIFESLANPVRRKILEILNNEGPLPYTELMRRCGIRDSRTLKHHLEKLGPLVAKNRGGTYVVTKLGSRVLRFVELLKDDLIDVITFVRTPKPLITFKPSIRHYLILTSILVIVCVVSGILDLPYLVFVFALSTLITLLIASIRRSKIIIVGINSVIEVVTTPISNSKRVIKCTLLGAEVSTNSVLRLLGLAKVSVITNAGGSLRTYTLGITTLDDARRYAEAVSKLLEGSEIKSITS